MPRRRRQRVSIMAMLTVRYDSEEPRNGCLRVLFVTPEKLSKSKVLMHRLEKAYERGRLARIVVDEVHCVSQWGHDFRPDYKFLHVLRSQFPGVPILGLTATASAEVVLDVQKMLGLKADCLVLRSSYNRPNLLYEVRFQSGPISSSYSTILGLLKSEFLGQSGIIYCLSQKDTEGLSAYLNEAGVASAHYHANVQAEQRARDHVAWLEDKIKVIVATVAFGMGIDKPNVRFVLHLSPSKSVENYYQESGRAGRDGRPSRVILFWRLGDIFRLANMVFSEQTGLAKLSQMIAYVVDTRQCRRRLLADGLGDNSWKAEHCGQSPCDVCSATSGNSEGLELDVTGALNKMSEILQESSLNSQRLTGAKLVDLLSKDKTVAATLSSIVSGIPSRRKQTRFCEYLIAWSLCNDVVTMDFHFTPYSTIVYVVSSGRRRASRLRLPADVLVDGGVGDDGEARARKRPAALAIDLLSD
uniref:ATP-dependent DNA helicase n=1 Tax=Mesocestoides corti TaxID=53468 RepID=A0A5K3F8K4_MESCO